MPRSKRKKRRTARSLTAAIRGEDRRVYFANGGTLAEWRGTHKVHTSRAEKRKNRGTDDRNAIRESQRQTEDD
jgi:hypothetical protein